MTFLRRKRASKLKYLKPRVLRHHGMRGFKRDTAATKVAHFLNWKSRISLPKSINGAPAIAHKILYGEDKEIQRGLVAERADFHCQKCGAHADWDSGEWDHIENAAGKRCDCLHNARWLCRPCHKSEHVQLEWTLA